MKHDLLVYLSKDSNGLISLVEIHNIIHNS